MTDKCPHPLEAVYGNDLNDVVQCHRCGHVFVPRRYGFRALVRRVLRRA